MGGKPSPISSVNISLFKVDVAFFAHERLVCTVIFKSRVMEQKVNCLFVSDLIYYTQFNLYPLYHVTESKTGNKDYQGMAMDTLQKKDKWPVKHDFVK